MVPPDDDFLDLLQPAQFASEAKRHRPFTLLSPIKALEFHRLDHVKFGVEQIQVVE